MQAISESMLQPVAFLCDDEVLLRRTASGDRTAFAQLVKAHQGRVLQLARRLLSSTHQAEDIAQEAFLRVYQSAGKFEPRAKFTTWLYRIVVNLCNDERRRWRFRPVRLEVDVPSPATRVESQTNDTQNAVQQAILKLPQRQKEVLVLHRFEGLSYRDIAHVCGISESAVESLLVRAYAHLRESLKSYKNKLTEG